MPSMKMSSYSNNKLRKLFFRRGSTGSSSSSSSSSSDLATMSISTPKRQSSTKKRLRKAVHFSEAPVVVHNEADAITLEERAAAFWSREELTDVKKNIKDTVCFLDSNTASSSAMLSTSARGLEKWLCPFAYRDARQKLLSAVMAEQELQKTEGVPDALLLADAAMDCTRGDAEAALARGKTDHECVLAFLTQRCSLLDDDKIFGAACCIRQRMRRRRANHRMAATTAMVVNA